MKIKKVIIEGFRAYGNKNNGTFDFTTSKDESSNFVAIYAPNGFGKTSFYDAVEWNLTGSIGRFVRDQTRAQNDAVSRSQNQSTRKQYVLRNRYITEDKPSQVTVITDKFEHIKKVPVPRRGSRDYLFEKPQFTSEIGDIFLSQEAIDTFLREEKPEARYTRFMDSFGDEDETYRSNLNIIQRELDLELRKLRKEKEQFKRIAEAPVKSSIFEEINKTIQSLRSHSENINPLNTSSNADDIFFLNQHALMRHHELEVAIQGLQTAIEDLATESNKLNEVSLAKDNKLLAQNAISTLEKSRVILEQRLALKSKINNLSSSISEYREKVLYVERLYSQLPEFLEIEKKLEKTKESLYSKQTNILDKKSKISSFEHRASECRKLLKNIDQDTGILKRLQVDSLSMYKDLDEALGEKINREREVSKTNSYVEQLKFKIAKNKEKLEEITNFTVSHFTIDRTDISLLLPESFSLVSLKIAFLEKQEKWTALQKANRALDKAKEYATQISSLITLGAELVTQEHLEQCPLCLHRHDSHMTLLDSIVKNPILTEYETEAINIKNKAQSEFDLSSENLKNLLEEWELTKNQIVDAIKIEISTDEADLNSALITLNEIQLDTQNIYKKIELLRSKVLGRTKEQLNEYIFNELELLNSRREVELSDLKKSILEIEQLRKDVKDESQKVECLNSELQLLIKIESYQNMSSFVLGNAISSVNVPEFLLEVKNQRKQDFHNVQSVYDESFNQLSRLDNDYPELQGVTLSSIDNQITIKRASIVEIDVLLSSFTMRLKQHIVDYEPEWSINDTSGKINESISQNQNKASKLRIQLSLYSLLREQLDDALPFIESLAAKKNLEQVKMNIIQKKNLLLELVDEYKETIKRLKKRINNFFYTDLINSIYHKIDPHPDFKKVIFNCEFPENRPPKLNVLVADEQGDIIAPSLYFSAAQVNILSLSIFLARALHVKDEEGNDVKCILIDDPVHSMDSINVLSMIDLLRAISKNFDRQIILSTHDSNFFDLLKKKIPKKQYKSIFIELETFGKVRRHSPLSY